MVRDRGFEPLTPSVSRKCSTTELTAPPMDGQTGRVQYALARAFSLMNSLLPIDATGSSGGT
jgi:hypothetical protein